MASSGGNSPGSTTTTTSGMQISGSEGGDFRRLMMEQRKRRRMESNRESARRSRMRKQMHLDDLAATATNLTSENARLSAGIAVASRQLIAVEAENLVLKAQMMELSSRLKSLDDILGWVEPGSAQGQGWFWNCPDWNKTWPNQPIGAAASASHDIFQY